MNPKNKKPNTLFPKTLVAASLISICFLGFKVISAKTETTQLKLLKEEIQHLLVVNDTIHNLIETSPSHRNLKKFPPLILSQKQSIDKIKIKTTSQDSIAVNDKLKNISASFKELQTLVLHLKKNQEKLEQEKTKLTKIYTKILKNSNASHIPTAQDLLIALEGKEVKTQSPKKLNPPRKTPLTKLYRDDSSPAGNTNSNLIEFDLTKQKISSLITSDSITRSQVKTLNLSYHIKSLSLEYQEKARYTIQNTYTAIGMLFSILFIITSLTAYLIFKIQRKTQDLDEEVREKTNHLQDLLKQEKLKQSQDPLTKLYNKSYFFNHTKPFIDEAINNSTPICAIIIDADYFSNINDIYGHDAGDTAIQNLSTLTKETFQDCLTVIARADEENIYILCQELTKSQLHAKLTTLKEKISKHPTVYQGTEFHLTVSIGYTYQNKPNESTNIDCLISLADEARFKAKEKGRDQICHILPN